MIISQKVEIDNKEDILYYYVNDIYTSIGAQTPTSASVTISPAPPLQVEWSIENDNTGGTSIAGAGINNTTGNITPTNTAGTFSIRAATDASAQCFDEAKSLIYDTSNADLTITELIWVGSVDITLLPDMVLIASTADAFATSQFSGAKIDPARHLCWQALLSADSDFGALFAKAWGDAHEVKSVSTYLGAEHPSGINNGTPAKNTTQDFHNNIIGQAIGAHKLGIGSNWNDSSVIDPIKDKITAILNDTDTQTPDPPWDDWPANYSTVDPDVTLDPEVNTDTVRLH